MPTVTAKSRQRTTARIPTAMRSTLEAAAELSGATVNQFMVQAARQHADRGISGTFVLVIRPGPGRQPAVS